MKAENTVIAGLTYSFKRQMQASMWALAFLACAAFLAVPSVAVARVSDDSIEYLEEAKSYLKKGDIKSAVIQLKNAIRADGDNVDARFELAILYLRGRDGPSAEKELKAARDRGIEESKVLLPLAQAYALQRKNREILEELKPEDWPKDVKAGILAARGGAYVALKKLDEAERELNEAIAVSPDSAFVLLALSQVLQAKGKFDDAEAQVDKALSIEPDNQRVLVRKGSLQQVRRDYEGAIKSYSKTLELNEGNVPARVARASAYIARGEDEAARVDVDAALAETPKNPIARYLNALLLARQKKYEEAVDTMQPVMGVLSGYPPALYLQASLSFAQGQIEQAQTQIQSYLARVPKSQRGQRLLAAIYLRKKSADKAIQLLEPMLKSAPDVRLLTLLGNAYVAVGRNEDAAALFEKVAESDPDNTDIRTRLALTRLNSGDRESAVKEFESILDNDPDEVRANLLLVLTHLRERKFDDALAAANTLKERMPENPMPENFLGTIYLGKKDTDSARKHFNKALEIQPDFTPATLNLAEIERVSGNLVAARQQYTKILDRDEKHEQAMLRMAQIAFTEKDNDKGVEWLQRAATANPKSKRPRIRLVNTLLRMRENQRALTAARELSQIAEKDPDSLDALARAQIAAGQLANGVSTYRQLAGLVPKSAVVRHRFGRALAAAKNNAEAAENFDKAIALDPNLLAARQDRVRVAYLEKGAEDALAIAKKMTEEAPDKAYGYLLQGDVQLQSENFEAASIAYAEAQQREPSSQTLNRQYRSLSRAGKYGVARALLENWLEKKPDDTSVRFLYASALIRSGHTSAAIRENETLLKSFPDNAVLLNDLAWLYGEVNDSRAIEFAQRAHKIAPQSAAIADTLGWLLVNGGDTAQGLDLLRKAHADAPEQNDIGYHFAAALSKSGKEAEALKILKSILDSGKPFNAIEDARKLYATLIKR